MPNIIPGDLIRFSVVLQTAAGAYEDPPGLEFCYRDGSGGPAPGVKGAPDNPYDLLDAALFRDDTGRYHIDLPATVAGRWKYRWAALDAFGAARGAVEGAFRVHVSWLP